MNTTRRGFPRTVAGGAVMAAGVRRAGAQQMTPVKIGPVVLADVGIAAAPLIAVEKGFFRQNGLEHHTTDFLPVKV